MERKTAYITGSSRGIGAALARAFYHKGYHVALHCVRNIDRMNELAKTLHTEGQSLWPDDSPQAKGWAADLSSHAQAKAWFAQAEEAFGPAHVLVNSAGVALFGLFQEQTPDDWAQVIHLNLMGTLYCTQLALPPMLAAHKGVILNISSIWGNAGASCEAVYAASKGGVNAFTKSLAKELGPCGIRINAIACGAVNTDMNNRLTPEEAFAFTQDVPLMRFGQPDEVAALALFMCSDEAAYLTGQVVTLDGGYL